MRYGCGQLDDQLAMLLRLSRHNAGVRRKEEAREESELRAHMAQRVNLGGNACTSELDGSHSAARSLRSGHVVDIRVHNDVRGFVEDKVANMAKRHPKATQQCRDIWPK